MRTPSKLTALLVLLPLATGACAADLLPRPAACSDPAPVLGSRDPRAPGFIVVFHAGTDARATTERLAGKYGFAAEHVWSSALQGFSADLPPAAVEGLRCEAEVDYLEHDAVMHLGA